MNFIRHFEKIGIDDLNLVGGKNASLGEMIQHLSSQGIRIPSGFAITAQAYRHHLTFNNLIDSLTHLVAQLDKNDLKASAGIALKIRQLLGSVPLPPDLCDEIRTAYQELQERYGKDCAVAVRSSATAEDLPTASFAGQQETYLNVRNVEELLEKCKESFASLFTDRAIFYRIEHGFDHLHVALSIGVQKMVRSDKASSGVIFTLDTESGFKDVIFINSAWGLGEGVVKGMVSPDEFYVHKPTLAQGYKPLLKKRCGKKALKVIYGTKGGVKTLKTRPDERISFSLTDEEIMDLSRQALAIESYYSRKLGRWSPMDIEWAKDGIDGALYIVQARPETIYSQKKQNAFIEEYQLDRKSLHSFPVLVIGKSVGSKVVVGVARVIESLTDIDVLQAGEILVTDMTDPDWVPIMKRASGIVTNQGGRTCHAAIVSRELGIPAIVGAHKATEKIKSGQTITLDCSSGEVGTVYSGTVPFNIDVRPPEKFSPLPVKLMLNVGNPDEAFKNTQLACDGVGLARLEFIINSSIKVHPMALVQPHRVGDGIIRKKIDLLTYGYEDKKDYFVATLAQETATIVAAFYPKPVIVRMSDFKSNEYKELVGGKFFEPLEENPMMGFRGASRYYHENYAEAFKLECQAMKKIRYEMGLDNLKLMVPFVRTPQEAEKVINLMAEQGITRGVNGIEVYMMVEIPSNALLIDEFSKFFDGFSIGSNDLTQLVLAADRDSALVASLFDERNEAVKKMFTLAIQGAHRNKKPIGICGQAPSDFPEIAQFLVDQKIDSLSLTPDTFAKTRQQLGKYVCP